MSHPQQSQSAPVAPEPKRELAFGVYEATPAFKSIEKHSCVCDANTLDLIAVTGPAGDELSQKYAEFFASAPAQVAALSARVAELEAALSDAVIIVEGYKLMEEGRGTNNPAIFRYGNWHNLGSFVESARNLLRGTK